MTAESHTPATPLAHAIGRRRPTLTGAIAWEFWRWARWGLLAMALFLAGAIAVGAALSWLGLSRYEPGDPRYSQWDTVWTLLPMACLLTLLYAFFFAVVWPFTSSESHGGRGPDRLFRLPLTTRKMALAYMTPGLLFAAGVSLPIGYLMSELPNVEFRSWTPWATCLLVLTLTALGQAWMMVFGAHHRRLGFCVLAAAALAFIKLLAAELAIAGGFSDYTLAILTCALVAASYAAGVAGLSLSRRGGLTFKTHELIERLANFELSSARARRFASAEEAQRWYEWRRLGWTLPGVQCAGLGFYLLFIPGMIWSVSVMGDTFDDFYRAWAWELNSVSIALFILLFVAPAMTGVMALSFDLQHRDRAQGSGAFYFTRPVSHHVLALARYTALAKNIVFGLVPLVALIAWYITSPTLRAQLLELSQISPGFGGPVLAPEFALAAIAIMWAAAFVVNWFAAGTLGVIIFAPAIVWMVLAGDNRSTSLEWDLTTAFAIAALVYAAVIVGVFGVVALRALRANAIGPRQLVTSLTVWAIAFSVLMSYFVLTGLVDRIGWDHPGVHVGIGLAIVICLMPAAPFVTTPYLIYGQRHRA